MTPKEKFRAKLLLLFVAILSFGYVFYNMFENFAGKRNELDKVEIENEKLIPLFKAAVNKEVEMYKSGWYSGCLKTSYMQVENLFTTIKEVSTYTRYGLASTQSHNRVLVKVEYNNGKKVDELYTDVGWNGTSRLSNPMLMRFVFENGKLVKAYSNGVEKEGSPSEAKAPIGHIINAIIRQDYKDNKSRYFPPDKTEKDFKKEWDNVK